MDYKECWKELKDWLKDGISYFDELAYKYIQNGNEAEWKRIDTRRTEYKNFYRKIEELENNIK